MDRTAKVVLGVIAALVLVAALGVGAQARVWATATDDTRAEIDALRTQRRHLVAAAAAAAHEATVLERAVALVRDRFMAAGTALDATTTAHDAVADAHNAGADLHNQGADAAAREAFAGAGAAALAEEEARVGAARATLTDLQQAIRDLEEHLDD